MRRPKPKGAVTRRLPLGVPPASAITLSACARAASDLQAGLVVGGTLLGRLHLARGPVEQAYAQMVLELLQPMADHGGRQAQVPAGRGQAAELDHAGEHLHVLQQHRHVSPRSGPLFASV